jgi:hypothetical protein
MAFNYSPKIVTDGLVLYLDAANPNSYTSGSTSWRDISRGGNNGTLVNGPTFDPSNGGSIVFDGINDYCTLESSASSIIQGKTNITVGIFFKLDTLATLRGLIGTLNYNCGANLGLVANNTGLQFYNDYSNTCYNIELSGIETGKWLYAVGTYDGTTTRLYLIKNGTLTQASGTTKTGNTNTFSSTFRVMGNQYFQNFTKGQCSISFTYNRTLSVTEILQNYNATKTRFGL